MPGMDDFYMAHARQRQREWQREAERARLARVAKRAARQRAARQRAARDSGETIATGGPTPPARDGDRRRTRRPPRLPRRVAAVPRRVAAVRRAAGYALLEAGLRLLTPPSRRSRVGAASVADPMSARGPEAP